MVSVLLSRMGDDAVQTNANFLISSNIMFRQSQNDKDTYQLKDKGIISILVFLNIIFFDILISILFCILFFIILKFSIW